MAADTEHGYEDVVADEGEPTVLDAVARPSSLLDQLRSKREELKEEHFVDLEVPGYEGVLLVRYGVVSVKRAEALGRRVQKEPRDQRTLLGAVDTLIEACQGIYVRREGFEEVQPIDPDWPTATLFDSHLAGLLAFQEEVSTAREVCRAVFPNDHGILRHAIAVGRWMQDVTLDMSEELLGE